MDTPAPRFIRRWLLTSILLAALVGGFNALIDPYLLIHAPRILGFNDRKPSVETEERLMKAYEVTRAVPHALILGTSRVDLGLDTRHPAWPADARPAYNLGIAAASPYTSFRYLQHVSATDQLHLVVLGLDFEYFLDASEAERSGSAEFESRLAIRPDGTANGRLGLQHARDLFHATLSLDALLDSFRTIGANLDPDSANLAPTGDLSEAGMRSDAAELGSWSLFAQRDLRNIRFYYGKTRNDQAMDDIRHIIELCRSHGTRLVIFINPVHADMLETFDLLGLWNDYEDWKRELVSILAAEPGPDIPLWDFSGYDPYSTESVPTDRNGMVHWFWEPSHYTKALGDKILERMFGGGPSDYGVLLTPATIDSRLAEVRAARQAYRDTHLRDVRRVRDIFTAMTRQPSTATATASLR